jgi:hypothetical protein
VDISLEVVAVKVPPLRDQEVPVVAAAEAAVAAATVVVVALIAMVLVDRVVQELF